MCIACNWSKFRGLLELDGRRLSELDPSRRLLLQAGAAFAATGVAAAAMPMRAEAAGDGKADLVFRSGPVYTVSGGREWARAVAVTGKQIVHVGDDAGAARFIGPRTLSWISPAGCCCRDSSRDTSIRSRAPRSPAVSIFRSIRWTKPSRL